MEYKNVVKDFAERTRVNLELIRNQLETKSQHEVYEVTQLVNSMLGLLIFPKEEYWYEKIRDKETKIDKIKYSQAISMRWPTINPTIDVPHKDFIDEENSRFGNEVSYIRNAFSHKNIEFLSKEDFINGKIAYPIVSLKLQNVDYGTVTWQATLSVAQLEMIADVFIKIILRE